MKLTENCQTKQNLQTALAGEIQAMMKYLYFSKLAKKAGYPQIAKIFKQTAHNEFFHALQWFKALHDNPKLTPQEALTMAILGETYEHTDMYPSFAKTALDEGYNDLAELFTLASNIEKTHAEQYQNILTQLEANKLYTSEQATNWKCAKCGHTHYGTKPPKECPLCHHDHKHFSQI